MTKKIIRILSLLSIIFIFIVFANTVSSQDIDRSKKFYAYNLMEKGIFHFNLNQFEAAIDYFTQSLKIYPSLYSAREWRAKSFYRTGQIENAREEYKRLISINPNDIRIRNQLDEIDFMLSHPETFDYEPNFIISAVYPLNKVLGDCIPVNISLISKNKVAVADFSSGKVGIYSIDGKYLYSLPKGNESFKQPFDITSDEDGNIYITDYKENIIYKYSKYMEKIAEFGGDDNSESSLYGPRGIVSDGRYNLYVIDRWNREIKKFSNNGDYILSVRNRVDGLYELFEPYDIEFHNEVVYITDTTSSSVFAFDNYGTFIKEYKDELISKPRGISLSHNKENLIIVDEENGILTLNIESGKVRKIAKLKDIKGRFLSAVETFDGRILGINESITGLFAFVDEIVKSSGLVMKILRSSMNPDSEKTTISHLVSINDKLGRPYIDITKEDIWIKEQEIEMGHPAGLDMFPDLNKSGVAITIINELSTETEKRKDDIKRFIKNQIVDKLGPNDLLQIVNINDKIIMKNNVYSDPLESVYYFDEDKYMNIKEVEIGKGLIYGIGQALSIYEKSSVVIFITGGDVPDESLGDVSAGDIYNYSLANDLPIYTVVFGKHEPNDFLTRLASESNGRLINYYKSPEINKVIDIIYENRKQYYIITYNSILGNSNDFDYKEAIIEITSNGMTGSAKVGYFDKYGN